MEILVDEADAVREAEAFLVCAAAGGDKKEMPRRDFDDEIAGDHHDALRRDDSIFPGVEVEGDRARSFVFGEGEGFVDADDLDFHISIVILRPQPKNLCVAIVIRFLVRRGSP